MDFSIVLMIALGAMLLFFMFNSRKRQKAHQEKLSNDLVPGAQVMTSFGLYGEVVSVDTEGLKVVLESAPGSRVTVHRQAIANIEPSVSAMNEGTNDNALSTDADIAERYSSDAENYASKSSYDSTSGYDNDTPRITDEELDAMNEAKRRDEDDSK